VVRWCCMAVLTAHLQYCSRPFCRAATYFELLHIGLHWLKKRRLRIWISSVHWTEMTRKQHAQLSQRDRAAGCVSNGQKWKTGTGRQYFTDIRLSSATVTIKIGLQSSRIRWKQTQNKGDYAVQGHSRSSRSVYLSKARMRLPISDWHHISYRFGVIAACCSNSGHFAFWTWVPLLGALGTTYDSSWGHWKARRGLPITVNWTFSLGVTAGAKSKNRSKIGDFAQTPQVWPKISGRSGRLHQFFGTDSKGN